MPSTAISAQGTAISIGTGSGSAKTVSALAAGYPTIVTATAHGFGNGDVETLSGVTGAAGLNAAFPVRNKTTNTYAVDFDSTGLTLGVSSGLATPVLYTEIANVHDYSGFDGSASEIDKTNMRSTAKEFLLGLVDNGQFTMNIDTAELDPGQAALKAKQLSGAIANFKVVDPIGTTYSFAGYVKKFSQAGGVDALKKSSVDIRITGAVTIA